MACNSIGIRYQLDFNVFGYSNGHRSIALSLATIPFLLQSYSVFGHHILCVDVQLYTVFYPNIDLNALIMYRALTFTLDLQSNMQFVSCRLFTKSK